VNGQGQNTVLNTGLGTAVELLSGIDSAKVEPQIIFFTDGIIDPPRHLDHDSLSRDWERLVTACVAARLRVSAVCPPGKAGLPSMEALASATGGLCIVTHEPAKVVGAVLPATSAEQGLRPSTDRTPLANVRVRQRRSMFLLVVLLVLAAAGVGVPVLLGGRAFRRRLQSPSGRGTKEGLAGIAEAVAQLRALAAEFGEPGARIRELAATIEAAGCTTFTEQREAGERMRKLLGEVLSVRDEVEDILSGIGTGDARARESLEFVDELLAKVLAADKIKEMVVVVGSLYDGSLHEPRPERNSAARGTILRIERRGYIIQQKVDAPKVLRFAKVVVSDGSGMKEA
jgi:molecular chaperone GrpE (heat shock protein)